MNYQDHPHQAPTPETTRNTSTAQTPAQVLRSSQAHLQRIQAREGARREQARVLGMELLAYALEDPEAFFKAMAEDGRFAPEDERLCGSFEEARDRLIAEWVERDTRQLTEHLQVAGEVLPQLRMWMRAWRKSGAWLWVHGPYGCGKTWQAVQLIRALHQEAGASIIVEDRPELWAPHLLCARQAITITYAVESDMLATLRPSSTTPKSTAWWASRPMLIVDEACAGQVTEWGEEQLFSIYDQRYRDQLPTVFLSNFHPNDAASPKAWGSGRLASRLMQRLGGSAMPWRVQMEGDKRR